MSKAAAAQQIEAPLSVSQLSLRITRLLEEGIGRVRVEGEVSNLRVPASGHAYFLLKDSDASIRCVCFKSTLGRIRARMADGAKIEVTGRVTAYTSRSEYQIIVEAVQSAGLGDLMRQFLELRDKLKAEGLFDESRKQALPRLPRVIGVATSPTGAAIRDILQVIGRRAPCVRVLIAPCAVQGAAAPAEIVRALRLLELDGRSEVVIAGRGGGSIEDLWAFNDERVVRAIAACRLPVVAAVGHETDTTLSDYAADQRAPTPSAAAELVTAGYEECLRAIERAEVQMERAMRALLETRTARLASLEDSWGLRRPLDRLAATIQRVDDLEERLHRAVFGQLHQSRSKLRDQTHRLALRSPQHRLRQSRDRLGHLVMALHRSHPERLWRPRLRQVRVEGFKLEEQLEKVVRRRLEERRRALRAAQQRLRAVGPESVLRRGYSFITDARGRRIITGPGQARSGQTLRVHSAGGEWKATPLTDEPELFDHL